MLSLKAQLLGEFGSIRSAGDAVLSVSSLEGLLRQRPARMSHQQDMKYSACRARLENNIGCLQLSSGQNTSAALLFANAQQQYSRLQPSDDESALAPGSTAQCGIRDHRADLMSNGAVAALMRGEDETALTGFEVGAYI